MTDTTNSDIRYFSTKTIIVLAVIILPLLGLGLLNFNTVKFDPLLAYLMLSIGFLISFWLLNKSIKYSIIPYLTLQLVFLWIYFDIQIQTVIGISLKLYGIAFGIAFFTAFYYIVFHFKYLWKNSLPFKFLLLFFLINVSYIAFNHYSDFRSEYIGLMDIINHSPKYLKLVAMTGVSETNVSFNESKFLGIYLEGLSPLIAFTTGLILFKNLQVKRGITIITEKVRDYFVYGFIAYYAVIAISLVLGINEIKIHNDRLWLDSLGMGSGGVELYLAMFVLVLLGFKYYLKSSKFIEYSINTIIFLNITVVILSVRKSCLTSMIIGISTFLILNYIYDKEKYYKFIKSCCSKYSLILLISALIIFIMFNERLLVNVLADFLDKFINPVTMFQRANIWHQFALNWFEKLNIFTILFGFGIDSARRLVFYITSMDPLGTGATVIPHWEPHNFYIRNFYEYGLMALIYYGAIFSILANNIKFIISKNTQRDIRILCNISLVLTLFYLIYTCSDIIRIPIAIIFFCLLGFFESAKYAQMNVPTE